LTRLTNDNADNQPLPPDNDRSGFKDIAEVLWLPALCVIATATLSWLIWYHTSVPCTADLSRFTGCSPAPLARYITIDIFGRILTYSALTGAGGGVWNWNMISKERAARRAAENRAAEAELALAEERKRADEERQHADEERQRANERRQRAYADQQAIWASLNEEKQALLAVLAEERRQAAEERRQAAIERQRAAEERQQAAKDRADLMAVVSGLLARLDERQNGNHAGAGDASN